MSEENQVVTVDNKYHKPLKTIVSILVLTGFLWLADVAGAAFPGPIDELIYDTIIMLVYGLFNYYSIPIRKK